MVIAIGIAFTLIGGVFIWLSQRTRIKSSAALRWPTTPGRVLESGLVESTSTENETTVHARVVYEYQVANQSYKGARIGIGASGGVFPNTVVQKHPVGMPVEVHYNPQNPADAALYVKKAQGCMFIIFGVVFLLFGLGALAGGIFGG